MAFAPTCTNYCRMSRLPSHHLHPKQRPPEIKSSTWQALAEDRHGPLGTTSKWRTHDGHGWWVFEVPRSRVCTQHQCREINNTPIERVAEFNFLGITINEFMNWGSHSVKIANKICRTLGVMNCLKRYLPLSALKIMYDSLILSHIQFGITCWGFEWGRLAKLQKRAVRIITNSKYNAHTEQLFKDLHLLKITVIFDVQCMKFWYKFSNNTLPNYFRSMFQYNSSLYETETRNHDRMHVFPTRTFGARNVLRHRLPELVYQFPADLIRKATRAVSDCLIRPLPASVNALLVNCA